MIPLIPGIPEEKEALKGTVTFWTDRLVELCRKEGIQLLFVGTPTPKNWDYRRHNGVSLHRQHLFQHVISKFYGLDLLYHVVFSSLFYHYSCLLISR